jgi:hypothetical protein
MWWMVKFEVERLASVGGFSLNFGGQCCLFADGQDIQKMGLYFHVELDERC